MNKLLSIEVARGVAAVIVVLYHAARHLNQDLDFRIGKLAFQFGHAGVDFFFVISGFIILFIHAPDLGQPDRLGHYAQRRFTRIYPIYWVILAVTVVLSIRHGMASPWEIAWAASLLPTSGDPMVGVAWTLQHEVIFYGVFAVLILHQRIGLALLGLWLAAMALGPLGGLPGVVVSTYNLEFFFGMGAAFWLRRGVVPIPHALFLMGVTGFSATAGLEVLGIVDGYAAWARLPYGLASTMIIVGLVEMERQGQLGIWTAVLWLGRASYSIYLFHLTFIGLTYKLWSAAGLAVLAPVWVSYGVIVLAGIGGSAAVSRMVEYPLMRWVRLRLEGYFSRS